jgi:hypothetical protein
MTPLQQLLQKQLMAPLLAQRPASLLGLGSLQLSVQEAFE